ncbi:Arylalkylamine N-acetyltransferase [Balamuthia mandrillaris]
MAAADSGLHFESATEDLLDELYALEVASYPSDEAATKEKMRLRLTAAAPFFRVAFQKDGGEEEKRLVGFVCSTLVEGDSLTHSSMAEHAPHGTTLCIHSVVIHKDFRRKGFGTKMLRAYMDHIAEQHPEITLVLLITHQYLVSFYQSCGFRLVGKSSVVHGPDPWFEMALTPSPSSS